jgi:3',5'-cyclic AMP phosphodiesterase CpdA
VIHHNFTPPPRFGTQTVLRNATAAMEMLAEAGVELVLSGHLHQAFVRTSEEFYRLGRPPVTIVHSGTTTSSRGRGGERGLNTCNWIRLEPTCVRIEQLLWNPDEERFAERSRHRYPRYPRRAWGLEAASP